MWKKTPPGRWPCVTQRHIRKYETSDRQIQMADRCTDTQTKIQAGRRTDRQVDPVAIKSNIPPALPVWWGSETRYALSDLSFSLLYFSVVRRSLRFVSSSVLILASFFFFLFCLSFFFCLGFLLSFVPEMCAGVSGRRANAAWWRLSCVLPCLCVCWCMQIGLFRAGGSCKRSFLALRPCGDRGKDLLPVCPFRQPSLTLWFDVVRKSKVHQTLSRRNGKNNAMSSQQKGKQSRR